MAATGVRLSSHATTSTRPVDASQDVLCGFRALPQVAKLSIVPQSECRVSVMDSGFMLGDGLWEGLR